MDNRIEKIKDRWNSIAEEWNSFRSEQIISQIVENQYSYFRPQLQLILKKFVKDFKNKRVLVPASGDNRAVFAFHLLGASVTSLDISEKQLEYSAKIADKHNWNIEFVCGNLMKLDEIKSNEYDLVYISNGVMVWVDDLDLMYKNIYRVLKANGHYIMYDRHPFMPPFDNNNTTELMIKKDYDSTGPFGNPSTFHWRLQDIINSMISSGLILKHIEEMHAEYGTYWVDEDKVNSTPREELDRLFNSKTNPLFALPQAISICAEKKCI